MKSVNDIRTTREVKTITCSDKKPTKGLVFQVWWKLGPLLKPLHFGEWVAEDVKSEKHILKPQYTKLKSYTSTTLHLQPIIHSGWWIWSSYFENQPSVFSAEVRHACEVWHEGTPGAEGDKVSLFSEQPACRVLPQRETDTHMRARGGDSITFLSPWLRQTSSA